MNTKKIYFKNLNGLRFIAAFLVIIHHTEQLKYFFKLDNYWNTIPFIGIIGKLGVVLFFVLSGFLITYLLLAEEQVCQSISIRKFYVRRMLRIWPLYFLLVIIGFFILPHIPLFHFPEYNPEEFYSNFTLKLILFALFLPNLVLPLFGIVPYVSHTWSIGTEEQFYLVWPVLMKFFKKHRLELMVFIILFYFGFSKFLARSYSDFLPFKEIINAFWSSFNIDCMAIGGVYAILLFQKSRWLRILHHTKLFYAVLIFTSALLIMGIRIPFIHYEFYALLFGLIILNLASNSNINISLENKYLNYLGNISYGLYMYHPIGISLAIAIGLPMGITSNWLLYPFVFLITIAIAGLSYKYFESYFLLFKHRFSIILSGS